MGLTTNAVMFCVGAFVGYRLGVRKSVQEVVAVVDETGEVVATEETMGSVFSGSEKRRLVPRVGGRVGYLQRRPNLMSKRLYTALGDSGTSYINPARQRLSYPHTGL